MVWAFESHNFQSFKRGVKKNRIRVYSLACGWDASQKIEMLLKTFRIKTLKKTYLCIDCSENMWLATEELSPEYHGKKVRIVYLYILRKISPSKRNFNRIYFESSMFSNCQILQISDLNNNI